MSHPFPVEVVGPDAAVRTWADLYGPDQILADMDRPLVSLATLPKWPGMGPDSGHGIGRELNKALGGGIRPGYALGFSAASAKSGKTMFLHQIADGLALRTAILAKEKGGEEPLTPVFWLSEMDVAALTWRALARWTGHEQGTFRAGRDPRAPRGTFTKEQLQGADALRSGLLAEARRFVFQLQPQTSGAALIHEVAEFVSVRVRALEAEHRGREVWPVVVFDPIQRWLDHSKTETEGGIELVETLGDVSTRNGWVVLLTSDTVKATVGRGEGRDTPQPPSVRGQQAFRGTYKLHHVLHAGVYLEPEEARDNLGAGDVNAYVVINRWGPKGDTAYPLEFDFPHARFWPRPDEERAAAPTANRRAAVARAEDLEADAP